MAGQLLIKNGRVIDPANHLDKTCDVLITDGKVAEVGNLNGAVEKSVARVIDATGKLVTPGLIDIHVHFRDPGDEEEETIASGSTAAVAAGFTSVVCMPNTNPAIESETDVEYVHRKGRQTRKTHVYVMGAITKKREGIELAEMGMMAEAGARGFTDDGNGVQNSAVMLRAMKYAKMFDVVIAQHCQDNSFAANGVMNAGYCSTILGMPGMDALAEEAMLWRDLQLVRKTQVRYHAQHLSTAGSVELIRQAKKDSLPVSCEVTPHHLLLTEECCSTYDTNYKVSPPLRAQKDVDALKAAIARGSGRCLGDRPRPAPAKRKGAGVPRRSVWDRQPGMCLGALRQGPDRAGNPRLARPDPDDDRQPRPHHRDRQGHAHPRQAGRRHDHRPEHRSGRST